ncbi:TIR domain-containing protein [Sphingobium sp. TomTYG75]
MAYRNKTYIAFDGDTDMHYYRLMTAWSAHDSFDFDIHNAHDLNTARDSSQEESIKRQLRERFANSKLFLVLIGENTRFLTKFVKWEIETAIRLDLPIVAININGSRQQDGFCPPSLKNSLAIYAPFNEKIITYAMNNWPNSHKKYSGDGKTGPYYYKEEIYKSLGL